MTGPNAPMFGKVPSKETRIKLKTVNSGINHRNYGIKQKQILCPYCNKSGGVMVMQRWHFDKCKNFNKTLTF